MDRVNLYGKKLIIALAIPIIALMVLATVKGVAKHTGTTVIIPIEGYDPRDLLSGHYLIYRLSFADSIPCELDNDNQVMYVCLQQTKDNDVTAHTVSSVDAEYAPCTAVLKGRCKQGRFTAGIERFYIPEAYSVKLDRVVRNQQAKLVVRIGSNGDAAIKDLLIDDVPWKDFLEENLE